MYHPDTQGNENITDKKRDEMVIKFMEIKEAYDVLSSEQTKQEFD